MNASQIPEASHCLVAPAVTPALRETLEMLAGSEPKSERLVLLTEAPAEPLPSGLARFVIASDTTGLVTAANMALRLARSAVRTLGFAETKPAALLAAGRAVEGGARRAVIIPEYSVAALRHHHLLRSGGLDQGLADPVAALTDLGNRLAGAACDVHRRLDATDRPLADPQDHATPDTVANAGRFGCGAYTEPGGAGGELGPLPSRIFCIGAHKTGTLSLSVALNRLGLDCKHFPFEMIAPLARGARDLSWPRRRYALADTPVHLAYRQLDADYPGAKFIFTHRDTESWLRSAERHIATHHVRLLPRLLPWLPRHREYRYAMQIRRHTFGTTGFNRARFAEFYMRHNAGVRTHFRDRPADLLELDIAAGEGWEKLCGFLGLPVPDMEFPHRNAGHSPDRCRRDPSTP